MELEHLPYYETRIGLQTIPGQDHFYGVNPKRVDCPPNPNEKLKWAEQFTELCFPQLHYTNSIISKLKFFRTRVMKMKPKTCYSYHTDLTIKVHIPLITNNDCFFLIEDEVFRLPADGNHYVVDTRKRHTFVNASFEERIHIVAHSWEYNN